MHGIDEKYIRKLIKQSKNPPASLVREILDNTNDLSRRSLEETAVLLSVENNDLRREIYAAAEHAKDEIYGKRVVLFAPLYVNNHCVNNCTYCGFKKDNKEIVRTHLTPEQIKQQTDRLLERGHMRVLMVAGEAGPKGINYVDYLTQSVKAIYDAEISVNGIKRKIKRVNVNVAPMKTEEFAKLKAMQIGTYQCFQETYHEETYRRVHPSGPKSDPNYRMSSYNRAFEAGIDDYGMGVLYGLYDYKFETLAMLQHIENLEKELGVGPHTVSVPRLEPVKGVRISESKRYPVNDDDFRKIVSVIRLSVPYTGIILSTRESPALRDELLDYGISQISAESSTTPGGYSSPKTAKETPDVGAKVGGQFETSDTRSLDEMVKTLMFKGYWPSFCAACYRKERTGEKIMNVIHSEQHIKPLCSVNGLVSLQEYLKDFASPETKKIGKKFIVNAMETMKDNKNLHRKCSSMMDEVSKGKRDLYI